LTAPPTTLLTRERSAPVMIILIHRVRCHFTNLTFPNPNQRQVLVELKTVPEQMHIAMTLYTIAPSERRIFSSLFWFYLTESYTVMITYIFF
jgi:hypothetical protein